jgi:hypothetical protein
MPEEQAPEAPSADESPHADESQWRRRKRLAEVFGDVLPETTSDERDPDPRAEGDGHEGWLRRQVPPHHG